MEHRDENPPEVYTYCKSPTVDKLIDLKKYEAYKCCYKILRMLTYKSHKYDIKAMYENFSQSGMFEEGMMNMFTSILSNGLKSSVIYRLNVDMIVDALEAMVYKLGFLEKLELI